ncbi:MAG: hypothetical protein KJ728_11900 [Alphaproteobacteria bacterium]|uniref:Uncharacterized protein n=1 Tax=viral metagenome TaxID=1070528 RepID=A0A6M3XBU3_9ZZZZ|nr:hypothetical protein [Alphaproteobacteria bacterium]
MKAVMAFAGKAKSAVGSMAGKAGSGGGGDGFSGKSLGGASRGLSALGSIMEFAGARQQAASLDQSARDETMAGRQEYIQANERVTAIDDEYNQLVGEQLVTASAMGIDAGSGSVIAARNAARDAADRERNLIRNSAEANARLRQARAMGLREAAKNARFGSVLKLGLDLGQAAFG